MKQLPNSNKHVIIICPAFEKWILQRASESKIDTAGFGYDSFESLCKASKREKVHEDKNYRKFVNTVVSKNPPAIATLRDWLEQSN